MFTIRQDNRPQCDLSIVIPLHNEEASIPQLLQQVVAALRSPELINRRSEIILVDDGSTDFTCQAVEQQMQHYPVPIQLISLRRNLGQTAAMQAGIEAAVGELIATLDGDLQNDPADLPRMVERLEASNLDLLCGRRMNRQDTLILRKIPSWIANRLIIACTGVKIHDYGCSLKLYRADVIQRVRLFGEMHRFIPVWATKVTSPSKIGEIEVRHHPRRFGSTHYGISRTFRVALDLLTVLFFMRFRARPGHFFGAIGLMLGALGTVMLAGAAFAKFGLGQDIGSRPLLLIGAVSFFSAVQLVCLGILAEMVTRIYLELPRNQSENIRSQISNLDAVQAQSAGIRQAS
ncbi:MAG: glycosyltransferase family 2 protein [Pirellulaceae bacterium]|nr:glycosyltransferase family 2 protein [Pirellulaceae bacterium]